MCECCSCTKPETIIIKCDCNNTTPQEETPPSVESPPVNTQQPPTPQCKKIRVDFLQLRVTEDSDTGAGDWTLVLDADGNPQTKEFPDDYIDDDDNIPYDIGISTLVPINEFTESFTIKISGFERDDWFRGGNDVLPIAQRTFSRDQNFGLGQVYDLSASNDDASYTVSIKISCAEKSTVIFSRSDLIETSMWRLERKNEKMKKKRNNSQVEINDSIALNTSIRALERYGWKIKMSDNDQFIFSGRGKPPVLNKKNFKKISKK